MAQTLSTLSVIAFIIAAVCLLLAVFFWFFFKIPTVIGDLTGRTARKSIAKMRTTNEKSGAKSYSPSKTNAERGKLTATASNLVTPSSVVQSTATPPMPQAHVATSVPPMPQASRPQAAEIPETALLTSNLQREVVSEATGLLGSEETGQLVTDDVHGAQETALLHYAPRTGGKKLTMIQEIVLIHTNEVIG